MKEASLSTRQRKEFDVDGDNFEATPRRNAGNCRTVSDDVLKSLLKPHTKECSRY